ncbi:DUF2441 domain-containing protein [Burkholderia sp. Ac-20349]|uniref:DUF2441 domain-containing protein n=1 Tax=Burkholderia sp. Ac-20349 TaxID=2703893 RepID=UPI00197CB183|nr:DUF2441 domain-containing protein [Burkholderia sp. Ac-20349]MBN3838875.1 DUF2441 domain-containing protein [Burkholderia sp. Ac-20349]
MNSFFHFTTVILEPKSIIRPGNWGFFLRTYDIRNQGHAMMLASEMVLEQIRQASFPDRPSRLNCNYVFDDEQIARQQRPVNFGLHFRLYEVRLVDKAQKTHRAAFNLLNARFPNQGVAYLPYAEDLAHRYWGGSDIQIPEVLTESPIEIVKALD